MSKSSKNTPQTANISSKAEKWKDRFGKAQLAQEPRFKKFAQYYDQLYAVIQNTPAPWRSKVFLPVLAKQTWNLAAKFLALKPGWQVRITDPVEDIDDEELRELVENIQGKLAWDYDNLELDESVRDKLFEPLIDAIVTGTGMGEPCWITKTKRRRRRVNFTEKGYADLSEEEVIETKVSYNDFEPVNIFNVYPSPDSGSNLYKAPWVITTSRKLISELKDAGVYTNLENLKTTASADDPNYKYNRSRDRLLNADAEQDESINMVTIYKCFEGNKICTYAESEDANADNGWVLIREESDKYWHERMPLVKFHVKKRPYSFWGEGIFEITQGLQLAYNDIFNHYMDDLNMTDGMLSAHESSNINDFVVEPGGVVTWEGEIKPEPIKFPEPNPNQLSLVLSLLDQAIEGATISQYAAGIPSSASDKTKGTATGILRLQEAAGDIVSFFKENFKQSILMIGRMYLSNNQQFLDAPTKFPYKKDMGEVTPQQLQYEMQLTIDDASMEPATKEEQRDNWVAFSGQFMGAVAAANVQADKYGTTPLVLDFSKFIEDLGEKFGYRNTDKLMLSDEEAQAAQQRFIEQMAAANQQANAKNGAAQDNNKPPSVSVSYKDTPEDVKRQIEQAAGLNPSTGISPAGIDQLTKTAGAIAPSQDMNNTNAGVR